MATMTITAGMIVARSIRSRPTGPSAASCGIEEKTAPPLAGRERLLPALPHKARDRGKQTGLVRNTLNRLLFYSKQVCVQFEFDYNHIATPTNKKEPFEAEGGTSLPVGRHTEQSAWKTGLPD